MALKKQAAPKRWRSKQAKEIVAAVQQAGGRVERTASGHLKVIGPAGSAIVASAPTPAAEVGAPSTTPWPRSGARPGWRCETLGPALPARMLEPSGLGTVAVERWAVAASPGGACHRPWPRWVDQALSEKLPTMGPLANGGPVYGA
jgi:hypothetical protein